jgi:hypothetical protein
MSNQATTAEPGSRAAVASYVATLSADLAAMARKQGLETLGYLLEMARLEAESSNRPNGGPNGAR